ncbi:MAG TPA: FG-GAP-like repeat-containing protein [Chthonomonadaceae bacterium]|nr:FG-GAP-like repeat-containing protein [Chthonomonadaceae bacterium]
MFRSRFPSRRSLSAVLALSAVALLIGMGCGGCKGGGGGQGSNPPSAQNYPEIVSAFYTGLIAMQVSGQASGNSTSAIALPSLTKATQLAPQEPATWANLGLYQLHQSKNEEAAQALEKARSLAPDNADIEALYGTLESRRGHAPEALTHFKRAIELEPQNLHFRYALVQFLDQMQTPDGDTEMQRQLEEILKAQPDNLAAQLLMAQVAARTGNAQLLRDMVARMGQRNATWPPEIRAHYDELKQAAAGPDPHQAVSHVAILRNVMVALPARRESLNRIKWGDASKPGEPLEKFVVLPSPSPLPAPPDTGLNFTAQTVSAPGMARWAVIRTLVLAPEIASDTAHNFPPSAGFHLQARPEGPAYTLLADGKEIRLIGPDSKAVTVPFPGGPKATPPSPDGVAALDFNYDFDPDLALAGAGGIRLFQQKKGAFTDVTAKSGLPADVLNGAYYGVWAADIESDGDLDLVLAPMKGAPLVLRNNGDGTWNVLRLFPGVTDARGFIWADLDNDGDADAAFLDAQGRLFLFENERSANFRAWPAPQDLGKVTALSLADPDRNGTLDLIALKADGAIVRLERNAAGDGWDTAELARWPEGANDATARLLWADLDNNGGVDLIASGKSGTKVWLADEKGGLQPFARPIPGRVLAVADAGSNGRLDLMALDSAGQPTRLVNAGTKNYHWQIIRPRAAYVALGADGKAAGDNRINTFGIGGVVEIRAALLYQKQPITGASLHFGLGENQKTDAARSIYSNGFASAEFDLKSDQAIIAPERLGGSCPWLFAWNGTGMGFVTDCIWRSPLGLKINAQDTAGIAQTEDWLKIRGDQLAPHDGFYDLRICAELWETHFFDYLALMTVDHPQGTDIFVDERFSIPPPPLAVQATAPPTPVARAVDDTGKDVTEIVRARDGNYLDTFGRGQYQGVTRDHYVEVELGEDAPKTGPLYLIATGWIHPTDTSINVAISQGHHEPPQGLSLEAPDGKGGWMTVKPGLGFPTGKIKTVLLDITGLFRPGTPRRLRLRTNLEIYWDYIAWAKGLPQTPMKTQRLALSGADLRYRGFSEAKRANVSSPELPDYDRLSGTAQRWLDLEGYYTRFGDVRPLLTKVDDRYVIMNAGDELALRFPVPPPPPAGWVRDFVLIGDGWVKDGNFNTTFSKTVLPLPAHDLKTYTTPPGRLQDDPVYRRHAQDWQEYHTRYVAPDAFRQAMLP